MQSSNWNQQDNKRYTGIGDQIFVSLTESYERQYFVDAYLRRRQALITDGNRRVVNAHIDQYTGRAPILRSALTLYLDGRITVTN